MQSTLVAGTQPCHFEPIWPGWLGWLGQSRRWRDALLWLLVLVLASLAGRYAYKSLEWSLPVAMLASAFHLLLHGVAATAAVAAAARLTDRIPNLDTPAAGLFRADDLIAAWPTASFAVLTGLIGAGLGLLAFALYLVLMQCFRINLNELFVGMRIPHYKHFLRMQVSDDRIMGHIVGFERTPDCDLDWVDGRPVVTYDEVQPILVDTFTVLADADAGVDGGEGWITEAESVA